MESNHTTQDRRAELVTLHDSLRIKQRLGHISTNRTMQEHLFPSIIKMGGRGYARSDLLSELLTLTGQVTTDQNMPLSESLLYQYVARIAETVVDCDEEGKRRLFKVLKSMAEERALELGQEVIPDLPPKKNKMSRKMKKRTQKSTFSSLAASRRAAELDANGSHLKA